MKLYVFLAKRLLSAVFVLFGLSILIFTIARVIPGDPARLALGPRAPEEVVQRLREQMHLDKPIYEQYFYWLRDALQGHLGQSLYTHRDVLVDIKEFLPATLELILFAAIINVIGAITLGVLSGRYAGKIVDHIVRIFAYIGVAVPSFVFAIIFQLVFAYFLHVFPAYGRLDENLVPPERITGFITIDSLLQGKIDIFLNALKHLFLPALSLALGTMAQEARITRASLIENINKDYTFNAISHGLPERLIMFKYLLKPSLIPTVAIMGLDMASLIANAFLVEIVFNWPGFSRYGISVMLRKDLNAIVGVVMVVGLVFALVNILVDLVTAVLDPRIRYRERGE